ncbi:MAG: helical backbone metal receptor [Woeseiaceae bacterium]|nr:helical backbone metal receptor [Woeseiaceae bacterium]
MMRWPAFAGLALCIAACSGGPGNDPTTERAETGPAQRVVTFAPHLAELMFAVGADEQLVGVSAWSDFPPPVRDLPLVGDAFTVDQEQLRLLEPDLLLVWESGMPSSTVDELRRANYRVEVIRTRGIADVGDAMARIGELTGRQDVAAEAIARYEREIDDLRTTYADAAPVNVFFQVSARPLYTVNGEHFISEVIAVCGGRNVFADLDDLAPSVAVEAVIERNPDVMLAGTGAGDDAFDVWNRWPDLAANRYGNQFLIPGDLIGRATPRLAAAGRAVCLALDQARDNRDARLADAN